MIPLHGEVGLATTRGAAGAELLDLAARSGCRGLLHALRIDGRWGNENAQGVSQGQRLSHGGQASARCTSIGIQGCFAFGFDSDDGEERTVDL